MLQATDSAILCFMYYGKNDFDKEETRSEVEYLRKEGRVFL